MKVKIKSTGEIVDVKPIGKKDIQGYELYSYIENGDFKVISSADFDNVPAKLKEPTMQEIIESKSASDNYKSKDNTPAKIIIGILIATIIFIAVLYFLPKNSTGYNNTNAIEVASDATLFNDSAYYIEQKKIELEKKRAIEKRDSIIRNSVIVTSAYISEPNSAGGVDANVYYKNISNKTIKYFDWQGYVKNAVNDIVESEIANQIYYNGRDTGPIKPGKRSGGRWDCAWYNFSAKKLYINAITITYMDNSVLELDALEVIKVMHKE